MHQRPALGAREDPLIDLLGVCLFAQDHAAPGAPQGLMGGGGDHVPVGHRVHMHAPRHQPRDMGHVHQQQRPYLVGDVPELGEIQRPGIGGCPRHDQPGPAGLGQGQDLVVIQPLRVLPHPVGYKAVIPAAEVDRAAVGQMAPVGEIHAQHRISGLQQGKIGGQIGLGAGMGLHVGMFRPKQGAGPLPGQLLHRIHPLAAPVIALARISFRIFIGQMAAHGRHHLGRGEIFRSDQLDILPLPPQLPFHGRGQGRVRLLQKLPLVHPAHSLSPARAKVFAPGFFHKNSLGRPPVPAAQANGWALWLWFARFGRIQAASPPSALRPLPAGFPVPRNDLHDPGLELRHPGKAGLQPPQDKKCASAQEQAPCRGV